MPDRGVASQGIFSCRCHFGYLVAQWWEPLPKALTFENDEIGFLKNHTSSKLNTFIHLLRYWSGPQKLILIWPGWKSQSQPPRFWRSIRRLLGATSWLCNMQRIGEPLIVGTCGPVLWAGKAWCLVLGCFFCQCTVVRSNLSDVLASYWFLDSGLLYVKSPGFQDKPDQPSTVGLQLRFGPDILLTTKLA